MSVRRWIPLVAGVLLAWPVRAITVEEFVQKVADREGAKPAAVLASLPPGTDVKGPLTEGAVVRVMGLFGVRLRTSHPEAPFPDAGVEKLLAVRAASTADAAEPPGERGRRKPHSKSPHRPRPPHRGRPS